MSGQRTGGRLGRQVDRRVDGWKNSCVGRWVDEQGDRLVNRKVSR